MSAALARVPLAAWAVVLAGVLLLAYGAPAPGYDAWWSLEWGRELAHGAAPDLTAPVAPTPHPLAIGVAALLTPGLLGALSLLSLGALGVATALLGARLFAPAAGVLAAAILLTRPLVVGAALEGSVDVPFLALVLGAGAAVAARHDRRALALLVVAGLLRPEAWALALLLAAWRAPRTLPLALLAPLIWMSFDLICTGDPLHSLHGTQDLADGLGRPQSLRTALDVAPDYLTVALGDGVALLGGAAAIAAVWVVPRRAALPLAVLGAGLLGFLVLGALGLPLLYRYTLLPAAALALLAAWAPFAHPRAVGLLALLALTVPATVDGLGDRTAAARGARAAQADLDALLDAPAAGCGALRLTQQRDAPQVAYRTGHRPIVSAAPPRGAATYVVARPGSALAGDRLAPTDRAQPAAALHLLATRGDRALASTCAGRARTDLGHASARLKTTRPRPTRKAREGSSAGASLHEPAWQEFPPLRENEHEVT